MAGLAVLWALATSCAVKLSESHFVQYAGADGLVSCYFYLSFTLFFVAAFLLYLVQYYSAYRVFSLLNSLTSVSYLAFATLIYWSGEVESEAFWTRSLVGSYLFLLLHITCYWNFVDEYFELQDAKRLFGLFCSAIFIGMGLAGVILSSSLFSISQLFVLLSGVSMCSALWAGWIRQSLIPVYDDTREEDETAQHIPWRQAAKMVLSSPLTLLLLAAPVVLQSMEILTEYSFFTAFEESFAGGAGDVEGSKLTVFLGHLATIVAIGSLLLGLLLNSRLIHRFGINNMILVIPVAFFLMFSGWVGFPLLCFPIFGFTLTEGLVYVIQENTINLLLNAVPSKLKSRIRVAVDFFGEPTGVLLAALLLSIPGISSLYLGLLISASAVFICLRLRAHYASALLSQLDAQRISFRLPARERLTGLMEYERRAAQLLILDRLEDPEQQHLAFQLVLAFPQQQSLLTKALEKLHFFDIKARQRLITLIDNSSYAEHPLILSLISRWAFDESELSLRCAALFFLAKHRQVAASDVAIYIDSPNLHLRAAALVTMHHSSQAGDRSIIEERLKLMLLSAEPSELLIAIELLCCGLLAHPLSYLLPLLSHDLIAVRRAAALAIEKTATPDEQKYAPALLEACAQTHDHSICQCLIPALGRLEDPQSILDLLHAGHHFSPKELRLAEGVLIRLGEKQKDNEELAQDLLTFAKSCDHKDLCRLLALRVVGKLNPSQLKRELPSLIDLELDKAYFYAYHRCSMLKQYPLLQLKLLEETLESRQRSVLDFILHLLSLDGTLTDSELIFHSLASPNPKIRGNAIETLEACCSSALFCQLRPLVVRSLPASDLLRIGQERGLFSLSLSSLLDQLENSTDSGDQLAALQIRALQDTSPNPFLAPNRELSRYDRP